MAEGKMAEGIFSKKGKLRGENDEGRAGSLLILYYVCKQQSAVYFLLQQAQRVLLFNVSNFQTLERSF
jgi:hypothetical protein